MENKTLQVLKETELLGQQFTVFGTAEQPLFLASDIANLLSLTNVSDMIKRVDEEELTKFNLGGQRGDTWFLTEDGLYEILMQSRKPIAKQFKKGVKTILKEIRKKGSYGNYDHLMAKLDFLERYLNVTNASTRERRLALKELGEAVGVTLPEDREDEQEGKHIKIEKGVYYSATILIKNLDTDYDNVRELNAELLWKGYLQNKEVKTKSGKYILNKVLTEKGLKYGKNIMSNYKGGTEQPRYTKEGFESLIMALNTKN